MVSGTCRRDFGLTKLAMTEVEVTLKIFPRLVSFGVAFPEFSVVGEHYGRINQLVGVGKDLFGIVRIFPSAEKSTAFPTWSNKASIGRLE